MNSKELLNQKAFQGLHRRYGGRPDFPERQRKAEYELSVINDMGFADYLLIVQDFLEFGRKCGHMPYDEIRWLEANCASMSLEEMVAYVDAHQTEPGISIGPGRGSAAGSEVCFELGITNIDPTRYDLMFERFLNPSRKTMPDIDTDFSFESRTLTIEYCKKKYGYDCVCGISTVAQAAPKGAIRLTARALATKEIQKNGLNPESEKAEVIRKDFLQMADKIAKFIPADTKHLADYMQELKEKFANDKTCLQIIKVSQLVEGTITNTGTHAAGVIIADKPVSNHIALMYDTNNNVYRTQCDMVQAEGIHGLLKMDFLGLRTLSTLTFAARLVKARTGEWIDFNKIPVENTVIQERIKTEMTATVFQFSSAFMKQIIKKIRPNTFEDLILINAIGRPGPMQYIDPIAAVKSGLTKPEYIIPEIGTILDKTYGYPVYQEQITQLMQMAGMTMAEADNIRKYMSKKKEKEFMKYKPRFIEGFVAKGADRTKTEEFWNQLVEFAKYAFNKSHAAAYVDVAYKCAYMMHYHPVEWMCASLEYAQNTEEILSIIEDAKKLGIQVLPPDVNKSKSTFCVEDDHTVRFGICAIKGCGESLKEILDKTTYASSLAEYMLQTRFGQGVLHTLIKAGAMDCFSDNRKALKNAVNILTTKLENIKKKEKAIAINNKIIYAIDNSHPTQDNWREIFEQYGLKVKTKNMPTKAKKLEDNQKKEAEIQVLVQQMMSFQIGTCFEDEFERMKEEKEVLGLYLSKHPVDLYDISPNVETLNNVFQGEHVIAGIVTEVLHKKTKAGAPIIFLTLEDKTGKQRINCWAKETENFGAYIKEDAVLEITADVKTKVEEIKDENGEKQVYTTTEMKVVSVKVPERKEQINERLVTTHFATIEEAAGFLNSHTQYIDNEKGIRLRIVINNRQIFTSKAKYNQCILIAKENT